MALSVFEETMRGFEARMALRRRMLRATGVSLPARPVSRAMQDAVRDSILACHGCDSGDICTGWLDRAAGATRAAPPDFCPNQDLFLRLGAGGPAKETPT